MHSFAQLFQAAWATAWDKHVPALFTWGCRPSMLPNSAEEDGRLSGVRKSCLARFPIAVCERIPDNNNLEKGFSDSGVNCHSGGRCGNGSRCQFTSSEGKECWHSAGFLFPFFIQSESLAYGWSHQLQDGSSSVKSLWNWWFFPKIGKQTSPRHCQIF